MSNISRNITPPFPIYYPEPVYGGNLSVPTAPDVRPSAMNPAYSVYQGSYGRFFAGVGAIDMQTDSADIGIKDYPNELDLLSEADDVQGNGVFDPAGSSPNIHPDYGVFSDKEDLPGYIVRDNMYAPSEVVDLTTDQQLMYVPAGAVAIDLAQREAIRNRQLLWELPPTFNPNPVPGIPGRMTVTARGDGWPIGPGPMGATLTEAPLPKGPNMLAMVAIGGIAIGILYATMKKPKARKNARRRKK